MIQTFYFTYRIFALNLVCLGPGILFAEPSPKKEVLFIASEDLRPQPGCYGHDAMLTRHLDALAGQDMVFAGACCQAATCRTSRLSLLTGRRPETTRVHTNGGPHFRTRTPDLVTLPQHFKNHGWTSISLGEIFYGVFHVRSRWNGPNSWSRPEGSPDEAITSWGHPRSDTGFPTRGFPSDKLVEPLTRDCMADGPGRNWKTAVFSQFSNKGAMGRSIRTDRWRLTRWTKSGKGKETFAVELFDLKRDPGCNVNGSGKPENADTFRQLTEKLKRG